VTFVSTGGTAPPADLETALLAGLAPDGGLYLPHPVRPVAADALGALRRRPFGEVALAVLGHLLGDSVPRDLLADAVAKAFDFPVPLVPLGERTFCLELFHGPTLAFKDFGARFMARLLGALAASRDRLLTVLVATSGDTGGAVAQAFHGVAHTQVLVLYPEGRVSTLQERQFATLGGNVQAVAVSGGFDDCQRLVKQALQDSDLARERALTTANSINVGRLLPQITYYVFAWADLPRAGDDLVISVPSGNFGNLTAGLLAKRMGLPVSRFVAATNVNDVVPEYLRTGRFAPRASRRTISSAMDVGNPSNFARMLALYGGDVARMREDVSGSSHADAEIRSCIAEVDRRFAGVLDPHSAVGYLGLQRALADRPDATGVFLATAHPAKFRETVEPVIGRPLSLPERLAACLERAPAVERIGPDLRDLKEMLRFTKSS
jgi:threonine synthase